MFERYTEKARRVVFFGRYEASQFGSPYIESEHLLLGLLRENKVIAVKFLPKSFSESDLRNQIERHTSPRPKTPTSVDLPISNECKHILHYAKDEADRLGHKHIGTEHLFLGMLLEKSCYAAELLKERGVTLEIARASIAEEPIEGPNREFSPAKSSGIPPGFRWKGLVYNPSSETIVIEMQRAGNPVVSRLFMRGKSAESYEAIGNPADNDSFQSPVTCASRPIIMFNSTKWENGGGDADGLYCFDLVTRELTVCVEKDSLPIPEPYRRSWVLSLVSLSDDARTLYLKIGLEKPVSTGAVVDYYLASLTLPEKKLELLSLLKDHRF